MPLLLPPNDMIVILENRGKLKLNGDDSGVPSSAVLPMSDDPEEFREAERRLRQLVSEAAAWPDTDKAKACLQRSGDLLQRICLAVRTKAAMLLKVRFPEDGDPILAPLVRVTVDASPSGDERYESFAMCLLPQHLQDTVHSGTAIRIPFQKSTAGRLLTLLADGIDCRHMDLIPLQRNERLAGLILLCSIDHPDAKSANSIAISESVTELIEIAGNQMLSALARWKQRRRERRRVREWQRIAGLACDMALKVNLQDVITDVELFGMPEAYSSIRGLRLTDVVVRSFHRNLSKQIADCAVEREVRTADFQLRIGAQPAQWFQARIEPTPEVQGGKVLLFLTANDRDMKLRVEVQHLNQQLIRASRLSVLGQISTEFAHQLKSPLQALMTSNELAMQWLKNGNRPMEDVLAKLNRIDSCVTELTKMIDSIREFARFRTLEVRRIDLNDMLDKALTLISDTVTHLNAEIRLIGIPDPCPVVADRTQMAHVFINLLVNALEAGRDFGVNRPLIEISASVIEKQDKVVISVKDNGPGLPEFNPEQVFEKFHTNKEDGLGLGLAISRDVCEQQGGSLEAVNNRNGSGCTFRVTLRSASHEIVDEEE